MKPQIKYYSNVVAYSNTGAHYTESSDGFKIDNSNPHSGLVYDGSGTDFLFFKSLIFAKLFLLAKNVHVLEHI